MKRTAGSRGYTIVEVMIFLVITGVLLASAMLVFRGRQERTQFNQGVREIDAQIRSIINETATGYYPNPNNINCTVPTPGQGVNITTSGAKAQGANEGCIYLGRVLQFTGNDVYRAYTIVGQQRTSTGQEVTTLGGTNDTAKQTVITPTTVHPTWPDATATFRLPWGITVKKVIPPSAVPVGAIAFVSSFGSYGASGLNSGSSVLNSVPLVGSSLTSNATQIASETEGMATDPVNPGRILVCLLSAGGDRQAAIIIGGSNNNTSTDVVMSVPSECN